MLKKKKILCVTVFFLILPTKKIKKVFLYESAICKLKNANPYNLERRHCSDRCAAASVLSANHAVASSSARGRWVVICRWSRIERVRKTGTRSKPISASIWRMNSKSKRRLIGIERCNNCARNGTTSSEQKIGARRRPPPDSGATRIVPTGRL